ncbi:hypothetical protein [Vibrio spartinae]|uniref:Phosphate ABC transporter substrate-binding protein n=1 Tax=Vibrio spartinae TaxID=1918945 RepID=A0A1N6M1R8_9VIBR|nr:hypothetical protein [Vibrio spartinae]QMV17060.1 hypothetical protein Vspart_04486 [Vibrio spartinae]SIO93365.1 hypothetical protein VSP9026_01030 [Vibrio spartinae]
MRRAPQRHRFYHIFSFWLVLNLFSLCPLSYAKSQPSILVIANVASHLPALTHHEIRQIYMGGTLSRKYQAVALEVGNPTRIRFNTKVIGLTESRIQSYWAQLLFTGRNHPPLEFSSVKELLNYVTKTNNAIGYVPAPVALPHNVIVVYQK